MTFEEWWEANINTASPLCRYDKAAAAWDYQQERINLLEQRIIGLQGHDNLRYIDKKLSEQENV